MLGLHGYREATEARPHLDNSKNGDEGTTMTHGPG